MVSSHNSGKDLGRGGEVCEGALKWESKSMCWACWKELTRRKEVLRRSWSRRRLDDCGRKAPNPAVTKGSSSPFHLQPKGNIFPVTLVCLGLLLPQFWVLSLILSGLLVPDTCSGWQHRDSASHLLTALPLCVKRGETFCNPPRTPPQFWVI